MRKTLIALFVVTSLGLAGAAGYGYAGASSSRTVEAQDENASTSKQTSKPAESTPASGQVTEATSSTPQPAQPDQPAPQPAAPQPTTATPPSATTPVSANKPTPTPTPTPTPQQPRVVTLMVNTTRGNWVFSERNYAMIGMAESDQTYIPCLSTEEVIGAKVTSWTAGWDGGIGNVRFPDGVWASRSGQNWFTVRANYHVRKDIFDAVQGGGPVRVSAVVQATCMPL